jgi:class 3 adenylate cyclase/pimeloyl-ACP methyl ester carboxylesterase
VAGPNETRYAQSRDAYIAYQINGEGPVTLLMSSYGSISVDAFDDEPHFARFLDGLTSFARVIRYDRRGVGLSDPIEPSSPPTLEQDVEDAIAVLDAAGIEHAVLFGAVTSCQTMLLLAAGHPERAAALVMVNGFARLERALDYPWGIPSEMLRSFQTEVTRPDSALDTTELLEIMSPSVAHDERFVRWWEDAGRRGASPATARALWSVSFYADVRDVLPSISVPTLVIHRRDCMWLRVGHGRHLAEHIPGTKYVEIGGADVPPFTENAEVVLEEIEEFLTGERHDRRTDRVLATVVFTDIVSSTEQAAGLGDRQWRELLDRHDALVRRQLARFGGREVKSTGDGFLASFDGPARAIRFAVAVRDGAGQLGIAIRAGVHSGEVELRGSDVAGIAVNIGERISNLADPGEVLVSSTVKDLVAGSGITFDDRGLHPLKGIPDEWRVFAADPAGA